jgi:hypothetical protein
MHRELWGIPIAGVMVLLVSCASYNRQAADFYGNVVAGDYVKADKALNQNKLLKKSRNRLLYLLEKGKVAHLAQKYGESNRYFNEADDLMEATRTSLKDVAMGTLLNPMMQRYKGEDFEKYMVHYYKALNYLQLGQPEEALVEARRITLRSQAQEDKVGAASKYANDAFSFMLQGLIYEQNRDINNAFIAYRNAADLYLQNKGTYYGIQMPLQLKKDLLRSAFQNGFWDELARYERLCNLKYEAGNSEDELIVFWENGLAPIKKEQNLFFSLSDGGAGGLVFVDGSGSFRIPLHLNSDSDKGKLKALQTVRVAIPAYEQQSLYYRQASLLMNDSAHEIEAAQNINELAFATLRQRMVQDLSLTLSRVALKKLAEIAATPKEDDKEKSKEKKQNRAGLALGIKVFALASEKADTRNWQSLPHTIYYTRVPLRQGANQLSLLLTGNTTKSIPLVIQNKGGLHFLNVCSVNRN